MLIYTPPAFREDDAETLYQMIAEVRLATLVTATDEGLMATPLPLILVPGEGPHGTLYGHLARGNRQWQTPALGEAMAIFAGPDAYVTPSWYVTKQEHGEVVPTWNYTAVHAYGTVAFFEDEAGLLDVVSRLTALHEGERAQPWSVDDAPEAYIRAQLKGIVGLRLSITRLEGKRKLSQNQPEANRAGIAAGLMQSKRAGERAIGAMVPTEKS